MKYISLSYEGNWKNNLKEGKGIFRWFNGNRYFFKLKSYEGDWKIDKRDGYGIFKWSNDER